MIIETPDLRRRQTIGEERGIIIKNRPAGLGKLPGEIILTDRRKPADTGGRYERRPVRDALRPDILLQRRAYTLKEDEGVADHAGKKWKGIFKTCRERAKRFLTALSQISLRGSAPGSLCR